MNIEETTERIMALAAAWLTAVINGAPEMSAHAALRTAIEELARQAVEAHKPKEYVSGPILDCEACMTPDACAIRGQCAHYLRERDATPPAAPEPGALTERHPVFSFLLGEGQLLGKSFGDRAPDGERGMFWWRSHLRAALAKGVAR